MGGKHAPRLREPLRWWLCLAACGLLLAGCDRGEPGAQAPSPAGTAVSQAASGSPDEPIVPGAPDFELPADWATQHPSLSPNAKLDVHLMALAESGIEPSPGDGEGRAWLVSTRPMPAASGERPPTPPGSPAEGRERPSLEVASYHRFEIRFEVGPQGIDEGGLLFLIPEAFWHWSDAQSRDPRAPGYTTASARSAGVGLEPVGSDATFRVTGRALAPGEQIDFVYGAGEVGARIDRYAERDAEIMIAVDADGDGFRGWIEQSARVDVHARPGAGIVAFGPPEIAPGEAFEITTSILDPIGNRALWPDATLDASGASLGAFRIRVLEDSDLGLADPSSSIEVQSDFAAPKRITLRPAPGEGTLRLAIEGRAALSGFDFTLPPIVVRESTTRLVWGDLHGHSRFSDGTGTAEDYFGYARDVARLDVVALTDHDHWGPRPLDAHPEAAARILQTARELHAPGRFVTLPGYEWTSWLYGHRHVLYFEDRFADWGTDGALPIFSSIDPDTDRPDELWTALRGRRALTFAHHSAGEPVAVDWSHRPDPELEPLTEIVSVHGSSEALDAPLPVRGGIPGYFVRDVLLAGERLGFIGSGDSHDGHPGLAQIASGGAGLAGLFTTALDRESLLDAMRARRTFATNGIRPFLEVTIDETPMGGSLVSGADSHTLRIRYEATAPIERVDLIRSGRIAALDSPEDRPHGQSLRLVRTIPGLAPGEFHYVRILQEDGGTAWSSPIFADAPASP